MAERMSVTQALDERNFLVKQINDRIDRTSFVEVIGCEKQILLGQQISKTEYASRAEVAYHRIIELMERYHRIHTAIMKSNSDTWIETSFGRFTVAVALSLRSRLQGTGTYEYDSDFEGNLYRKLRKEYEEKMELVKSSGAEHSVELLDPLKAAGRAELLEERKDMLLRELDTRIKLSNAITVIDL